MEEKEKKESHGVVSAGLKVRKAKGRCAGKAAPDKGEAGRLCLRRPIPKERKKKQEKKKRKKKVF